MTVLSRDALQDSPLADLHAIASELAIDGFRRLRKNELVDAILEHQGGEDGAAEAAEVAEPEEARPRRRRGGRGRASKAAEEQAEGGEAEAAPAEAEADPAAEAEAEPAAEAEAEPAAEAEAEPAAEAAGEPAAEARAEPAAEAEAEPAPEAEAEPAPEPERRPRRRARTRAAADEPVAEPEAQEEEAEAAPAAPVRRARGRADAVADAEPVVEGTVELAGNGAAFLRLGDGGEPTDDDVYISAAQVRRCELVDGDRVSGPARRPRRSERYASLIRVDTINGVPAEEVSQGTPFDELPAAWPAQRLALDSDDPTLKAVEWLTPLGRGTRATIVGPARSGKSEVLRRLAGALAAQPDLDVTAVLLGVRPEEITDWQQHGPLAPGAALGFAVSAEAQAQALERTVDTAKRLAARGGDAVVLVDTLDGVPLAAARRALAAARNIDGGGSLTIVATAGQPLGGETTVIALDPGLTAAASFPALDLAASGTLRPELLVGEAGAEEIAKARVAALRER